MSLHCHLFASIVFHLVVFCLMQVVLFLHLEAHQDIFQEQRHILACSYIWAFQKQLEQEIEAVFFIPGAQEVLNQLVRGIFLQQFREYLDVLVDSGIVECFGQDLQS